MIDQLKDVFDDFEKCYHVFVNNFYLNDNTLNICQATLNNKNSTCLIENSSNLEIVFGAVDNCLIVNDDKNQGVSKCNALVFNDNIIWFIELKEVVFSGNSKADKNRKKRSRKKAVNQLASTINYFKDKGVDFEFIKVGALISFPPYIDEINPISIPQVSTQTRLLEFINLCGYTDLYEGNHIVM